MPTWAAASDVSARLTYETIDGSSNPTQTQVEAWIDEAEGRIRVILRAAGIGTTYSDTDTVNVLTHHVTDYVEGRVLLAWSSGAGGEQDREAGEVLIVKFDAFLEEVRANPIQFGSELAATGDVSDSIQMVRSHVLDNEDSLTIADSDFAPKFEIDKVNY